MSVKKDINLFLRWKDINLTTVNIHINGLGIKFDSKSDNIHTVRSYIVEGKNE